MTGSQTLSKSSSFSGLAFFGSSKNDEQRLPVWYDDCPFTNEAILKSSISKHGGNINSRSESETQTLTKSSSSLGSFFSKSWSLRSSKEDEQRLPVWYDDCPFTNEAILKSGVNNSSSETQTLTKSSSSLGSFFSKSWSLRSSKDDEQRLPVWYDECPEPILKSSSSETLAKSSSSSFRDILPKWFPGSPKEVEQRLPKWYDDCPFATNDYAEEHGGNTNINNSTSRLEVELSNRGSKTLTQTLTNTSSILLSVLEEEEGDDCSSCDEEVQGAGYSSLVFIGSSKDDEQRLPAWYDDCPFSTNEPILKSTSSTSRHGGKSSISSSNPKTFSLTRTASRLSILASHI